MLRFRFRQLPHCQSSGSNRKSAGTGARKHFLQNHQFPKNVFSKTSSYLIENRLFWTYEAPPEHLTPAILVLHGQTDVEQLTVVVHVGVVAVSAALAAKRVADVVADAGGVAGQRQQLRGPQMVRDNLQQ